MECYRVLKPNHFCAILIGDTRRNFLMIMHEHLFVFRKPGEGEKLNNLKESMF